MAKNCDFLACWNGFLNRKTGDEDSDGERDDSFCMEPSQRRWVPSESCVVRRGVRVCVRV